MQAEDSSTNPGSVSSERPGPRTACGLLALIVLLGLALRLWGIGWSLPDARHPLATYHPDELINLNAAAAADIPHGRLDIGFYNYGAFDFYLVSLVQTVGRGYHWIPAATPDTSDISPTESLKRQAPERAALFLCGRLVSALLGTATIVVVFLLGSHLYGRGVGLMAALLNAIAPLAVVHSHFFTVDVPATFFVSLALLWAARLLHGAAWRDIVGAAIWCGLAAATKYTAAIVAVAPLAALVIHARSARADGMRSWAAPASLKALALLAISAVVFLLACPGPWLNWDVFWNGTYPGSGVRYELFEHARTGHGYLFMNTGPGWWYHLTVSLRYGLGLPLLLLSMAGVAYAAKRHEPGDIVLLAFLLIAYAVSSISAVRFARYLIPLYPALCVLAARVAFARLSWPLWRPMSIGASVLVCLLTLVIAAGLSHAMAVPDPRDRAADYLRQYGKLGSTIAFAHTPWFYSPPLSPWWAAADFRVRARAMDETGQFQFRIAESEWDTGVLTPSPEYVVLSSFEMQHEWRRLRLPPAVAFMNALRNRYSATVFRPAAVFGVSPDDPGAPEDLLYVLPIEYIYSRARGN